MFFNAVRHTVTDKFVMTYNRGEGRVTPNVRATTLEIFEGLKAESQNRWPNLKSDIGAFNNIFSMFFPAGFYNKTFKWPASFWDKVYEPFIRNMAVRLTELARRIG